MDKRKPLTPLFTTLEQACKVFPNKIALHYRVWGKRKQNEIKLSEWRNCTFQEFWTLTNSIADNIIKYGGKQGDRALVFWIPPSQMDALALMFALMKVEIVIVWLDPRTMTISKLLSNIEAISPRIIFADSVVKNIIKGLKIASRLTCAELILGSKELNGSSKMRIRKSEDEEKRKIIDLEGGAIMFTTGATGSPKGVRLTSRCLAAQADAYQNLAELYGLGNPGEWIAVHTALNFNALDLALGNTTVALPDPANPGKMKPEWLEEIDMLYQPCIITGSRIIFENLISASENRKDLSTPYLPHLRLAFGAGAPITPQLAQRVCQALPCLKDFSSAYGCTEGLPLMIAGWNSTWNGSLESDLSRKCIEEGFGVALGQTCPHVDVFILKLEKAKEMDDSAPKRISTEIWSDSFSAATGEIGELVIRSPSVSPRYVNNELANHALKFFHPETETIPMHRTGDLVCKDESGTIWLLGRAAQALRLSSGILVPPTCVESLFDGVKGVKRTAFVGIGKDKINPVLIVLRFKKFWNEPLDSALYLSRIKENEKWNSIIDNKLQIIEYKEAEEFPMDLRHNSKIRREILSVWAEKAIRKQIKIQRI